MTDPAPRPSSIAPAIFWIGALLTLAGAVLFLGNRTGLYPSFPFAGALTATVGITLQLAARGLTTPRSGVPAIEKRPTSIVIVALALLLFLPMLLGALLLLGNNISDGASVGGWIGSLAFAGFSAVLVGFLVREATRWILQRGAGHGERPTP